MQARRQWAGDLGLFRQRLGHERHAVAQRIEIDGSLPWSRPQLPAGMQIHLGPPGARDRPFALVARDELVDMAHLELHARLLRPVALALEEVVEEPELQLAPIVGVEVRPVLDAVRLEPLLLGRRAHEAFEVAARMQALPAPVRRREEWNRYAVPSGGASPVILIIERVRKDLVAELAAVFLQLAVRQRLVAAHQGAGDAAARSARAEAVLHRLHLHG